MIVQDSTCNFGFYLDLYLFIGLNGQLREHVDDVDQKFHKRKNVNTVVEDNEFDPADYNVQEIL